MFCGKPLRQSYYMFKPSILQDGFLFSGGYTHRILFQFLYSNRTIHTYNHRSVWWYAVGNVFQGNDDIRGEFYTVELLTNCIRISA